MTTSRKKLFVHILKWSEGMQWNRKRNLMRDDTGFCTRSRTVITDKEILRKSKHTTRENHNSSVAEELRNAADRKRDLWCQSYRETSACLNNTVFSELTFLQWLFYSDVWRSFENHINYQHECFTTTNRHYNVLFYLQQYNISTVLSFKTYFLLNALPQKFGRFIYLLSKRHSDLIFR